MRLVQSTKIAWEACLFIMITGATSVAQELVVNAPEVAASLGVREGKAYWVEGAIGEFCTPTAVRKVDTGGGAYATLFSQTAPACTYEPLKVRVDEAYVYFVDHAPANDRIYRIWQGGAAAPSLVATANDAILDFEVDDEHVWWVDDDGIKTKLKDGSGPTDTYQEHIIFLLVGEIALTARADGDIFWTAGIPGSSQVVLRRAKDDTSSTPVNLTETAPDNPHHLALGSASYDDDAYVYWSEEDARIRRVSRTGGTIQTLSAGAAGRTVNGLVVDDTHVYWGEIAAGTYLIRRVPKGGGTINNVALPANAPFVAGLDELHVYYTVGDIYRVRKDSTVTLGDLAWLGMEVTQGIQDLNNSVTLVKDKPTLVRVFPSTTIRDMPSVRTVLHGERDGDPLPGSPLAPSVAVRNFPSGISSVDRDNVTQCFEFLLPESWRSGTVELRAQVNPEGTVPEANVGNNNITRTVTFQNQTAAQRACVAVIPVRTHAGIYRHTTEGFWDIVDRFETLWPIPDVDIYTIDAVVEELQCCHFFGPFPYPYYGPYEYPDDSDWIVASIEVRSWFTNDPDRCDNEMWYMGMIHPSEGGTLNGQALVPPPFGNASIVRMRTNPPFANAFANPPGGTTMAHELAHNQGREHVDCGGPDGPDPGYPYCAATPPDCCGIAPNNSQTGFWGYDFISRTYIDPFNADDLLAYGGRRWVSPYTWEALVDSLASSESAPKEQQTTPARRAWIPNTPPTDGPPNPACTGGAGDCCAAHASPGCNIDACCTAVCACDAFCCDTEWDQYCAGTGFQNSGCGAELLCATCFAQDGDRLAVSGFVATDPLSGDFALVYRAPDGMFDPNRFPDTSADPNAPHVEFLDVNGSLLDSYGVLTRAVGDRPQGSRETFAALLPYSANAAMLRLRLQGATLAERRISPHLPAVNITAPTYGQTIGASMTIEWNATDADGDALLCSVQYSPDHGHSWHSLATDYPGDGDATTTMTVTSMATSLIPGSDVQSAPGSSRIRVIATDGVNSGMALSEPFLVPRHNPLPHIVSPRNGAHFRHSDQIWLRGRGLDAEDGTVPGTGLSWIVSGIGTVGTGRELTLNGLPPGQRTISLRATDSTGAFATTQITVFIDTQPVESSDCCSAHDDTGCDNSVCEAAVCACDPFCCDNEWDSFCASTGFGTSGCGAEILCPSMCTAAGVGADFDGDGTPDSVDNCPFVANASQADGDLDGTGDACDNCPLLANASQANADGDEFGDACDPCTHSSNIENDPDGDGICADDNCPFVANADQGDGDSDGVGNACDNCPMHANAPQDDCDDDGIGDMCAIANGTALDCNHNGVPDACDIAFQHVRDANANGVPDPCEAIAIVSSTPPNGAIDARQPHPINSPTPAAGYTQLTLTFSGAATGLVPASFGVAVEPAGGPVPSIVTVSIAGNNATLTLNQPIPAGKWTRVTHTESGTSTRIGFLPGDVNNDRTASPVDVLRLIDRLNGVCAPPPPPCNYAAYQTDADRSGATNPADILRVIDLLNGADAFEVWNLRTLPP